MLHPTRTLPRRGHTSGPASGPTSGRAPATRRLLGVLAAVTVTLAACAGGGPGGAAPDLDGNWRLVQGSGPGGEVPVLPDHPITLDIDGASWSGTAACNTYSGEVALRGDRVEIGGFAVTEMACMDDDVMDAEAAYLAALTAVEQAELASDELVLTGPATALRFQR